ncbi:MAG: LytTR family DNA-binding domain-containing protein [Lachnospiraceae bacterium]|nr:LytTR family DNA-binding domain-containing protein [Lachnospiraceae bacterium]
MEYRIAICDDSPADAEYVASLVKAWASEAGAIALTESFTSAESFLFRYEEDKNFDILLLDIEMGRMNGVELAKRVRSANREVQIVFITGYNDYIADGYDVEALHYILKPVHKEKLEAVLERARERLKKNEAALFVSTPDGMMRLPLYEIRFIEVRSNYVTIHGAQEVTVKMTLSALEKKLDESFFRAGRSHIVNMRYIRKITRTEVILEGGAAVPLSRGCYEPLNRAFIRYF